MGGNGVAADIKGKEFDLPLEVVVNGTNKQLVRQSETLQLDKSSFQLSRRMA